MICSPALVFDRREAVALRRRSVTRAAAATHSKPSSACWSPSRQLKHTHTHIRPQRPGLPWCCWRASPPPAPTPAAVTVPVQAATASALLPVARSAASVAGDAPTVPSAPPLQQSPQQKQKTTSGVFEKSPSMRGGASPEFRLVSYSPDVGGGFPIQLVGSHRSGYLMLPESAAADEAFE